MVVHFFGTIIGCLHTVSCMHISLAERQHLVLVAALSSPVASCCYLSASQSNQEMVCQGWPQHRCSMPWLRNGHIKYHRLVTVPLIGPAFYKITTVESGIFGT